MSRCGEVSTFNANPSRLPDVELIAQQPCGIYVYSCTLCSTRGSHFRSIPYRFAAIFSAFLSGIHYVMQGELMETLLENLVCLSLSFKILYREIWQYSRNISIYFFKLCSSIFPKVFGLSTTISMSSAKRIKSLAHSILESN